MWRLACSSGLCMFVQFLQLQKLVHHWDNLTTSAGYCADYLPLQPVQQEPDLTAGSVTVRRLQGHRYCNELMLSDIYCERNHFRYHFVYLSSPDPILSCLILSHRTESYLILFHPTVSFTFFFLILYFIESPIPASASTSTHDMLLWLDILYRNIYINIKFLPPIAWSPPAPLPGKVWGIATTAQPRRSSSAQRSGCCSAWWIQWICHNFKGISWEYYVGFVGISWGNLL